MTTVHIVDDTESLRHQLREALELSWESLGWQKDAFPYIAEWDLVWDLTEALADQDKGASVAGAGDVVVTDLYPSGYWTKVKRLRQNTSFSKKQTLPGDPTNMYRAVLDIRRRFLPQLAKYELSVIVLTYVPHYIERIRRSPLTKDELKAVANSVRAAVRDEGRILLEKRNRDVKDLSNYDEAITEVNRILLERAA